MTIMRERTTIAALPAQIWPYLADPELMAGWNPKIVEVDRSARGPVCLGERYAMTYRMSGKSQQMCVAVVELQVNQRLVLRHEQDPARPDQYVLEEYHLAELAGKTHVTQRINLKHSGMPRWARPLFWLIHTFGRPTGKRYLEELRDLVEADSVGKKPRYSTLNVAP